MKERLDVILVEKGLASSRDKAKRTIMAGLVTVDGRVEDKAGQKFDMASDFSVKEDICPYVSRGGLKMEKAISEFSLDITGSICADLGASTGGFTDCLLKNGAAKVYAVDVGYGQLDYKLRNDERVINIERTNIRYMDTGLIEDPIGLACIDVSFISLKHILPVASEILAQDGKIVCLVKPQFEAGREQVGKNGIVRDPDVHAEVLKNVSGYASDNGLVPEGMTWSPVKGTKGNIEYLLCLVRYADDGIKTRSDKIMTSEGEFDPYDIVRSAHEALNL